MRYRDIPFPVSVIAQISQVKVVWSPQHVCSLCQSQALWKGHGCHTLTEMAVRVIYVTFVLMGLRANHMLRIYERFGHFNRNTVHLHILVVIQSVNYVLAVQSIKSWVRSIIVHIKHQERGRSRISVTLTVA